MLGVRPIENPEDIVTIPASELGTFIHELHGRAHQAVGELPGAGEPWTAAHQRALREIAEQKAATFEQRGITGHQRLWAVEKERVLITLAAMLDEDSRWRAENNAAVKAAELEFGLNGKPPIKVEVPGGTISMRGSADKIDVADGRIYVTDIKSGRRSGFTSIKQDDPAPYGTKLQLPVYAYAALRDPRPGPPGDGWRTGSFTRTAAASTSSSTDAVRRALRAGARGPRRRHRGGPLSRTATGGRRLLLRPVCVLQPRRHRIRRPRRERKRTDVRAPPTSSSLVARSSTTEVAMS